MLGYREQKVYAELAECYYELDDVKKAISVLEDGLRISSIHHTYLHQMLGQYYRDEGQYENALNHLEEVQYWIKKDEKGDWGFVLDGIDKDWVQRTIEKLKDLLGR